MNDKNRGSGFALCALISSIVLIILAVVVPLRVPPEECYSAVLKAEAVPFFMFLVCVIGISVQKHNDQRRIINNRKMFQAEYDAYVDRTGIVRSNTQAELICLDEYQFHVSIPQYLWVEQDILYMFPKSDYYIDEYTTEYCKPDMSMLQLKTIPLASILYFEEIGELRRYATVSGGGSTLDSRRMGRAIREDDVALIAASISPITSEVVSEDERVVELIYKNQQGGIEHLEFNHSAYQVFNQIMPFKEMRKIIGLNTVQNMESAQTSVQTPRNPHRAREQMDQLYELKEAGMITEEEFAEQRRRILDSIYIRKFDKLQGCHMTALMLYDSPDAI